MRAKYRQWAVDYLVEHPEVVLEKIDFKDEFFSSKPIYFEIGSGKGDFIVEKAKQNPNSNFLAVEKVRTIAGMLAKKIVDEELSNVKVFPNDFAIIANEINKDYVDEIYLNFVDPWPKKRHAKRRLTFITFLNQYYRILKKGGRLVFKSDNTALYEFTCEELKQTKFEILIEEENYIFDETNDAMTEYERKFRSQGQHIHRIIARK